MYERQCVLGADVHRACQRRGLKFGLMKRRCPLQVPLPRCHPGTRTLTVIGDCVLHSLHASPSPLPQLLCSTFIWPHSPLLAFNAEPGSPLIKVKASQCLDETEKEKKEGGGVVWESFWRKTWRKEWKPSLPLHDRRSVEYRWGWPSFYISGTALGASCHSHYFNEPSPESIWREVSAQNKSVLKHFWRVFQTFCCLVSEASALIFFSIYFFFFARRLSQN